MTDVATDDKTTINVLLGCDPQVNVRITETPSGTLFVVVEPADPAMPIGDIDGVFFNLSDDTSLDALNFFPSANEGSIFSPVTSIQAAADSVNTLSNGAQTADSYDVGIQFGLVDSSTAGAVPQASFTLFGDGGPLTLDDLDLDSFATVIDSDGGNGQVLTTGDAPDDDPVLVSKEVLFEDFNDIHTPTDSALVESNDGWTAQYDKLVTNGHNDGTVTFTEVATDGPVTLTMDLTTHNTHVFENSGHYADSLRIEVQIDGGDWVLLDEFQVNDAGTSIVGSETGQSFDASGSTVTYSGGILDTAGDTAQFRVVSDISAGDEYIKIDNVSITASEETNGTTQTVETTLLADDFDDIHQPTDSDIVASSDGWDARYDKLVTDGHNDGTLTFNEVATDGPVSLTLDLTTHNTHVFENSGHYQDSLRIEVQIDGGDWVLLDEFQVNDAGTSIVGSETGQSFDTSGSTVTYSGGILDTAGDTAQFRVVSDISAGDEVIKIDNVQVTGTVETNGTMQTVETTLLAEDFDDIHDPAQSDAIVCDSGWDVRGDELATDGCNDGVLKFASVAADGDVEVSFDARVNDASLFEASGHYADNVALQVRLDDGSWQTLDNFVVNHEGTALVGSQTGNEITEDGSSLTYSGGILDGIEGDVQFRLYSDISASNEQVFFDNFEVTEVAETVVPGGDDDCPEVTVDFDGASSGDVASGQFAGVTVSAQRSGDSLASENDAMIFDSNSPTGGDHDLEYADQGNILIISEDNDSSDADDNAHGGTISFEFEEVSEVVSLNFLDIEEAGGTVDLFDNDGALIRTLDIPASGDNSSQELAIDTAGVSSMDVNLVGSGAVDDLVYQPDCECDAQYDAGYIAGVPILFTVEEDQTKDEDAELVDDMM